MDRWGGRCAGGLPHTEETRYTALPITSSLANGTSYLTPTVLMGHWYLLIVDVTV